MNPSKVLTSLTARVNVSASISVMEMQDLDGIGSLLTGTQLALTTMDKVDMPSLSRNPP
jgi:hypothetical protein